MLIIVLIIALAVLVLLFGGSLGGHAVGGEGAGGIVSSLGGWLDQLAQFAGTPAGGKVIVVGAITVAAVITWRSLPKIAIFLLGCAFVVIAVSAASASGS